MMRPWLQLIAALVATVATSRARADIGDRECPDPKHYVMTPNAGCVKRLSMNDRYLAALDALGKDPKKALDTFAAGCTAKHAQSCTQLGFMYDTGKVRVVGAKTEIVVAKDQAKAAKMWERGCELGDGAGCRKRGRDFLKTDWKQARAWLERGCKANDGASCGILAYVLDKVDPPQPEEAKPYYARSEKLLAAQCPGDGFACFIRGYFFEIGAGVPVDLGKALDAYRRSCKAGYGEGCDQLARNLDKTKTNAAEAVDAYEKACRYDWASACGTAAVRLANADKTNASTVPLELAKHGCELDPKECYAYAEMYRVGQGTKEDPAMATSMYRDACNAGLQSACLKYATRAHDGVGTKADLPAANAVLDKACTAGDVDNCEQLAIYLTTDKTDDAHAHVVAKKACDLGANHACFIVGWQIRNNRRGEAKTEAEAGKESLVIFEKLCEAQNPRACDEAGDIYADGIGVAKDLPKALERYIKACDDKTDPRASACRSAASKMVDGPAKDLATATRLLARACARGSDVCQYMGGFAIGPDDVVKAVAELAPQCAAQNDAACYGEALVRLRGTTEDKRIAVERLATTCARKKHTASCVAHGKVIYGGEAGPADKAKGEQLYAKYCDDGIADACVLLATVFDDRKDGAEAVRFYDKACQQKNADGCNGVGFAYYTAKKGVGWDVRKATEYYDKGCQLGGAQACSNIAEMYRYGIAAAADPKKAFEVFTKACELYSQYGCASVAHYLATGEGGVKKDMKRATEILRTTCEREVPDACIELATILESERGSASEIARVRQRAFDLTKQQVERNNPEYMYWFGTFYRDGVATMKDPAKAREWFVKSCESFDPLGCIAAGKTLAASTAAADRDQARVFLERACGAGIEDGCKGLKMSDAPTTPGKVKAAKGCACGATGAAGGEAALIVVVALVFARRRRARR
jgi:MYXO-CTERM domain-containing protein